MARVGLAQARPNQYAITLLLAHFSFNVMSYFSSDLFLIFLIIIMFLNIRARDDEQSPFP